MFVVDSADTDRIPIAKTELMAILNVHTLMWNYTIGRGVKRCLSSCLRKQTGCKRSIKSEPGSFPDSVLYRLRKLSGYQVFGIESGLLWKVTLNLEKDSKKVSIGLLKS